MVTNGHIKVKTKLFQVTPPPKCQSWARDVSYDLKKTLPSGDELHSDKRWWLTMYDRLNVKNVFIVQKSLQLWISKPIFFFHNTFLVFMLPCTHPSLFMLPYVRISKESFLDLFLSNYMPVNVTWQWKPWNFTDWKKPKLLNSSLSFYDISLKKTQHINVINKWCSWESWCHNFSKG